MQNKGKLIVDLDGTICPIKRREDSYSDLVPYRDMVEKLREYKNDGFTIVIYTSRNMKTFEGNLGKINVHTARMTMDWLDKWEIPYDEILFGKPWPGEKGFYIDDRAIRPDEFMKYTFDELEEIVENSRKSLWKGEKSDV